MTETAELVAEPTALEESPQPVQADETTSTPVAVTPVEDDPQVKKLRDRMAEQGRQVKDALRIVEEQNRQIAYLTDVVQKQGRALTTMEQQRMDAYLASLPEEERLAKKVEILEKRLQTAGPNRPVQPQAPQPTSTQPTQEQIRAQAQKILDTVNTQYGTSLTLDDTDDSGDPLYEWDSPDEFKASAVGAARAMKRAQKEAPVAKKQEPEAATSGKQAEPRQSSPAAPRPVPNPRNAPMDTTHLRKIVTDASSRGTRVSPLEAKRRLQEAREQAAARLPKA